MYNPTKAISRLYDLVDDAKFHRRVIQQNPNLSDTVRTLALARNSAIITQARRTLREAQFQHARQRIEESTDAIASATSAQVCLVMGGKGSMDSGGSQGSNQSNQMGGYDAGYEGAFGAGR